MKLYIMCISILFLQRFSAQDTICGVVVHYNIDSSSLPKSWLKSPINGQFESLENKEISRSRKILIQALAKYPSEVLRKNVQKIYVVYTLNFYGQDYGATYTGGTIYIANKGEGMGYSDYYLEKSFHHEFSSLLLTNNPDKINKDKWIQLNSYPYGNGGVEALKENSDSQVLSDNFFKAGFLHQYAMSDFENDLNAFAENIFSPDKQFWEAIEAYDTLKQKLEILIDFYASIDPVFTQLYFEQFRL